MNAAAKYIIWDAAKLLRDDGNVATAHLLVEVGEAVALLIAAVDDVLTYEHVSDQQLARLQAARDRVVGDV